MPTLMPRKRSQCHVWMLSYSSLLRLNPKDPAVESLVGAYEEDQAAAPQKSRKPPAKEVRFGNLDLFPSSSRFVSDRGDDAESPPWESYSYDRRHSPIPQFTRMMLVRSYFVRERIRTLTLAQEKRDCLGIFAIVCLRLPLRRAAEVLQDLELGRGYSFVSLGRAVRRFEEDVTQILIEEVVAFEKGDTR